MIARPKSFEELQAPTRERARNASRQAQRRVYASGRWQAIRNIILGEQPGTRPPPPSMIGAKFSPTAAQIADAVPSTPRSKWTSTPPAVPTPTPTGTPSTNPQAGPPAPVAQ